MLATVKTAQVYGFRADTRKLEISKYAPKPPRSLTAALGRELEKYDQLCDVMESRLLRAIAVLQRDLQREQARLEAEEDAKMAVDQSEPPKESQTDDMEVVETSGLEPTDGPLGLPPDPAPVQATPLTSPNAGPAARRQSAISLSSLNRPQFPHKLDLSPASMRFSPEDLPPGLVSPVTLAPKTARLTSTNEFPADLMAALASAEQVNVGNRPVDIDLTALDDAVVNPMDPSLGSSADRPIELDLDGIGMDMDMDLFVNTAASQSADMSGVFAPTASSSNGQVKPKQEDIDIEIFPDVLSTTEPSQNASVFNALEAPAAGGDNTNGSGQATFGAAPNSNAPTTTDGAASGDTHFDINGLDFVNFPSMDGSNFQFDGTNPDMNFDVDVNALLSMSSGEGTEQTQRSLGGSAPVETGGA
ncbi:hypothetical protein OF83DRAFT_447297 [Amylostereum chailletii]|nr:hypothetical protein OF83DRAFT_447297 [Amylostereum chailletii]